MRCGLYWRHLANVTEYASRRCEVCYLRRVLHLHADHVVRKEHATDYTRTDDVDTDGDVDGALLAGGDACVESGVTTVDVVEHQHATVVPDAGRQPSTSRRRPVAAAASAISSSVPADDRRYSTLGDARHTRHGAEFQLGVVRHRPELEPLCIYSTVNTTSLYLVGGRIG